jgi:hypothetical protein
MSGPRSRVFAVRNSVALRAKAGEDPDHAVLTRTHIGVLSVNDPVAHVYFHFVVPGRDIQNLGLITVSRGLTGLYAVHEDQRAHRSAGHDELGRIRRMRFLVPPEPTAGG